MLSRVADSIYWLNRYIERADNYARFVDANISLTLDLPPGMAEQWTPLIETTGDVTLFDKLYDRSTSREAVLSFLIWDERNPNSIASCITRAHDNARTVRDVLSGDLWHHVNRLHLEMRELVHGDQELLNDPLPFAARIHHECLYFQALMDTTISHTESWHFGNLGRLLERADKTTRLLDVKYFILLPRVEDVGKSFDLLQWSSVLKSAGAYEMYTVKYGTIEPISIARFLILDDAFPRAIRFCLIHAEGSLRAVTGSSSGQFANRAEKELSRFRADLDYSEMEDVVRAGLHPYLDTLQSRINDVGHALYEAYFRLE